jgi:hypothetical protein
VIVINYVRVSKLASSAATRSYKTVMENLYILDLDEETAASNAWLLPHLGVK